MTTTIAMMTRRTPKTTMTKRREFGEEGMRGSALNNGGSSLSNATLEFLVTSSYGGFLLTDSISVKRTLSFPYSVSFFLCFSMTISFYSIHTLSVASFHFCKTRSLISRFHSVLDSCFICF